MKTNFHLDYTLLKLPVNPTSESGFLQLRREGAVLEERIYIPRIPQGGASASQ